MAGSISLAIPILSSIFKALIRRFYLVTDLNQPLVLKAMNILSHLVVAVEIIILLAGAIVILPYLPSNISPLFNLYKLKRISFSGWQYKDQSETGTYCDLNLMLFSLTFLSGAWLFIFAGGIIFTVIHLSNRNTN